jgi:hypothetical protein
MAVISRKFKELVLYIASKSITDDHFGTVKLNKTLFYIDQRAMQIWGKSVTGVSYKKDLLGPVPQDMRLTLEEMQAVKEISIFERPISRQDEEGEGFIQKRVIPLAVPDLNQFDSKETDLINAVIDDFRGSSGPKLSDLSHDLIGWKLASYDQEIPLTANFIKERPLYPTEVELGKKVAAEIAA